MTSYTRQDVPADIAVYVGEFASQPLVFAHLLDATPELDLDHVEVLQAHRGRRLAARFPSATAAQILALGEGFNTLILILPAAHPALECPLGETQHLLPLGSFRGTIPHLTETP